jgi:hypothetical protein
VLGFGERLRGNRWRWNMCVSRGFVSPACNIPHTIGKHSPKQQILSNGHVLVVRFGNTAKGTRIKLRNHLIMLARTNIHCFTISVITRIELGNHLSMPERTKIHCFILLLPPHQMLEAYLPLPSSISGERVGTVVLYNTYASTCLNRH